MGTELFSGSDKLFRLGTKFWKYEKFPFGKL